MLLMPANNGRLQFFNIQTNLNEYQLDILQGDYINTSNKASSKSSNQIRAVEYDDNEKIICVLVASVLKLGKKSTVRASIQFWHHRNLKFYLHTSVQIEGVDHIENARIKFFRVSNRLILAIQETKSLIKFWNFKSNLFNYFLYYFKVVKKGLLKSKDIHL